MLYDITKICANIWTIHFSFRNIPRYTPKAYCHATRKSEIRQKNRKARKLRFVLILFSCTVEFTIKRLYYLYNVEVWFLLCRVSHPEWGTHSAKTSIWTSNDLWSLHQAPPPPPPSPPRGRGKNFFAFIGGYIHSS